MRLEVFVFNFNGRKTLPCTIESLHNSAELEVDITIIDDHSTDDSIEFIKKCYPEIKIDILPYNTKRLNLLRNRALHLAKGEFFFITDNDLKFDEYCLIELLKVMQSDKSIASCTPRLMYWDEPERIYTADIKMHYIGAAISTNRDKMIKESSLSITSNTGGGICLLRRDAALKVGGYDEALLMGWGDDGEFYQRLLRTGYKCLFVPQAFALHENKLSETIRKYRVTGQTYNRARFILSHYSLSLLILSFPAMVLYEIIEIFFVTVKGVFLQYLDGNYLVIKDFRNIIEKRAFIQKIRTVSDYDVLFSGELYIAPALLNKFTLFKTAVSLLSSFLNVYWKLIRTVLPYQSR